MIIPILLLMTLDGPTLEEAQACRAHIELFIEDVARESEHVAGPTWFIRDWWTRKAIEAGAPDDDGAALEALKSNLEQLRTEAPEQFAGGRQYCVDAAIDAGAVPGMGPG